MEVATASAAVPPDDIRSDVRPVWNLFWLTPLRCRLIFAEIVLFGFFSGWYFLTHDCPIDLSGDEAQYWDWSRRLDLSYYSKGPVIAYLIRASCSIFGDTMPAVRFPALVLAAGTSLCIYWLTLKLFSSDRLALGAVLIGAIVPLYTAGGTLMTIDPPFFFFWALATCLAVKAVMDASRWAWPLAGVVVGLGFLTKYAMLLWLPSVLLFLALDRNSRRWLRSAWPWLMIAVALAFTTPVLMWNARHGWVSFRHVATQTNTGNGNFLSFLGSQFGILNPPVAVAMVVAVCYAIGARGRADVHRRQMIYLICIGLPFFLICLLDSLRTKVQPNWPAPAYFTLMILTAYFLSTRLRSIALWRPWRPWIYGAMVFGLLVQPVLHGSTMLYAITGWYNRRFPDSPQITPPRFDVVFKLRGIADPFARTVSEGLKQLPPGSIVLCEDYQDASQLAFYVDGQPNTYFAGSYWTDPRERRRLTQFDMWPDRRLDRQELIGKDVIYVGSMSFAPMKSSFEKIEFLKEVNIERHGMRLRSIWVWKCAGFKGMRRPDGQGAY